MFIDFHFNLLTTIVLGAITLSLLVQLVFYWGLFSRLAFHKKIVKPEMEQKWPPVSVVISARNAVLELEKNLPYILYQDYPNDEVVVVNDSSDDGTEELLIDLARLEPKLNVVHIRQNLNFFQGKKFPLSLGIKSAKNEILLLTDADCHPTSNQ
ncbi:MAG: glycosyltransferase, partial [Bacteroidales bacterium]|nr:glycosyltransferase [Bacteroidales bacterium]